MTNNVQIHFGPFALDPSTGELRRRMRRIHLRPQPLQLLVLLLSRPGDVITLDEMRQALWPDQPFVDSEHGVGVAIKKLRDALGDDPSHPYYIETIRRRGYRFIANVIVDKPTTIPEQNLVGRGPQLQEIDDCLTEVIRNKRQTVFVSGEAGIGKTAFVDEFVRRTVAADVSVRVARGQCVEGNGEWEPYYPVLDALGNLLRGRGSNVSIDRLTTLAPTWMIHFPSLIKRQHHERLRSEVATATPGRMLREIEEALEAIAADGPLILVFEDLQWLDTASVDLLSVLARHRNPAKLLVIGTFRPLELTPHPLKAVKQDLLIHDLARKIVLPRLTQSEISEYLAAESSGAVVPHGLAETLYQHSAGNPLFMIATLEHMTLRGVLSRDEQGWQVRRPLDQIAIEVPESLRDMIELEISRLTGEEQRVLEVASIQGTSFSSRLCAQPADLDAVGFDDLCDGLSRRHHIIRAVAPRRHPDGTMSTTYEFVHALYREVLYQRQSPGGRALLHRQLGERLEMLLENHAGEAAAELADHFEKALDWERAVRYHCLAADNALRRRSHLEAAAILERALELVSRLPITDRVTAETELLEKIAAITREARLAESTERARMPRR